MMSTYSPMTIFGRFFWKSVKSVKLGASKICHISKTKTGRALIFVVYDIYRVALAISLSLKTSNIFPYWKFWLKNGQKSEFSGKLEKSGNYAKNAILLFSMCFEHKNTLSKVCWKILILKKLEHLHFIRVRPWKNGPKFDDVIGGHVRGPKFENSSFHVL